MVRKNLRKRSFAVFMTLAMIASMFSGWMLPNYAATTVSSAEVESITISNISSIAAGDKLIFNYNTRAMNNIGGEYGSYTKYQGLGHTLIALDGSTLTASDGGDISTLIWVVEEDGGSLYLKNYNTGEYLYLDGSNLYVKSDGTKGAFTFTGDSGGLYVKSAGKCICGYSSGTFFYGGSYLPSFYRVTSMVESGGGTETPVEPETYAITVSDATHGTVTADKTTAAEGDTVTLTVTPADGYELDALTVTKAGGGTVTVSDANTFTMPGDAVTVAATFKEAATSGGEGTITIKPATSLEDGKMYLVASMDDTYAMSSEHSSGGTSIQNSRRMPYPVTINGTNITSDKDLTKCVWTAKENGSLTQNVDGTDYYLAANYGSLFFITSSDSNFSTYFHNWAFSENGSRLYYTNNSGGQYNIYHNTSDGVFMAQSGSSDTTQYKCHLYEVTLCQHKSGSTLVAAKAANCVDDGCVEHYECNDCHTAFSDAAMTTEIDAVIPALGHDYDEGVDNGDSITYTCQRTTCDADTEGHVKVVEKDPRLKQLTLSGVTAEFSDDGSYPWIVNPLTDANSTTITNGLISSNQGKGSQTSTTTITFSSQKDFELSFDYACEGETNYDYMTITLDGSTKVAEKYGNTAIIFNSYSTDLKAGDHTLKLEYRKDSSGDRGADTAYIYNIVAKTGCEHLNGSTFHEAVEANCKEAGNVAYYECNDCHKFFADAAMTQMLDSVIIPATGKHNFNEDGVCTNVLHDGTSTCGATKAWDGTSKEEPAQADGVYQISTGAELAWFADEVNSGSTAIKGVLLDDIDLADYSWTPIANTNSNKFTGSLDGQEYSVTGLKVEVATTYAGLFGYLGTGATVKDLNVSGSVKSTYSSGAYAGGITGYAYGSTTSKANILNCMFTGDVNCNGSGGGIVGYSTNATIDGCEYTGGAISTPVTSGYAGGIVGNSTYTTVRNCAVRSGSITSSSTAGGIAGAATYQYIQNNYSLATVSGNTLVGGILGQNGYSTSTYSVRNNIFGGKVEGTGTNGKGGIVGRNAASTAYYAVISNNYMVADCGTANFIGSNFREATDVHNAIIQSDGSLSTAVEVTPVTATGAKGTALSGTSDTLIGAVQAWQQNSAEGVFFAWNKLGNIATFDPGFQVTIVTGVAGAAITFDGEEVEVDESGTAVIPDVSVGEHSYTVSAEGYATVERTVDVVDADVTENVTMQTHSHIWNAPTWSWAEDYSSATAHFTCAGCVETRDVVDEAPTVVKSVEETCGADGAGVYTATVTGPDNQSYNNSTESVVIPATGQHSFNNEGRCTVCGTMADFLVEMDGEYWIYTAAALDEFATRVTGGEDFAGKTVNIGADFTANDSYQGAGIYSSTTGSMKSFNGTLDGHDHTVTVNMNVSVSAAAGVGLINDLGASGTVKNLTIAGTVSGTISSSGNLYLGAVVGYDRGGTIENCTVTANVTDTSTGYGSVYVGGVVGDDRGTVKNCTVTGDVSGRYTSSASAVRMGGIVGQMSTGCVVDSCTYTGGTVSGDPAATTKISYAGGIVGNNNATDTILKNCAVIGGTVTGYHAGGIAGGSSGKVLNNYSTATVSGTKDTGGVVAALSTVYSVVRNNYFAGTISSGAAAPGAIVSDTSTKSVTQNNYALEGTATDLVKTVYQSGTNETNWAQAKDNAFFNASGNLTWPEDATGIVPVDASGAALSDTQDIANVSTLLKALQTWQENSAEGVYEPWKKGTPHPVFGIQEHEHEYGEPEYVWTETEDGYTVTATVTCSECSETEEGHSVTETATATYSVTTEPTCSTAGVGTYTVNFENSELFTAQTKEVEIAATGEHSYGEASYEWTETEDGYTVTATVTCANCDESAECHSITETVTATYAETEAATCTEGGSGTYTAAFTNTTYFAAQTKDVTTDPTGHEFENGVCKHCGLVDKDAYGDAHIIIHPEKDGAAVDLGLTIYETAKDDTNRTITITPQDGDAREFLVFVDDGNGGYEILSPNEDGSYTVASDATVTIAVKGDANGDGQVDIGDLVVLRAVASGQQPTAIYDGIDKLAADLNGDGAITLSDIVLAANRVQAKAS